MDLIWHNIKMASNTSPAPYAVTTSSDYSSAFSGWTAFDGVNTDAGKCWSANANTGWITFDFGINNKQKVGCVEISARVTTVDGAPKDFTIEISDDNLSWTIVKTVVNETGWTSAESRKYMLTENYSTRYVRINTTSNNGRVRLDIGEVRIAYILPINKSLILHDGEYKKFNPKILGKDPTIDVVPKMTSDTSPLGKVTARGAYNPAWQAFDKDSSTYWYDNGSSESNPSWLQYEFDSPKIINKIALDSLIITGSAYGIKEFTLLGSNDGLNYDSLLSVNNHPNRNTKETYHFNNNNEYLLYKLQFGLSYHNYYTLVSSFEMYEMATPNTPAFWSTISTTLPTSNQFIEKGMRSLSPLLNRTLTQLEPTPMTQKNDILVSGEMGKVFSKTIDLKKYLDIRSIRTEVEINANY